MSAWKFYASLFTITALFTASVSASPILSEDGGNFSNNWVSPTIVQNGTTVVSGSGAPEWMGGDRLDIFQFSGLAGLSPIVFNFSLTGSYNPANYANGGGSIYYSYVPFTNSYTVDQGNGIVLGSQDLLAGTFGVVNNPWEAANGSNRGSSSFTLNLDSASDGNLFLALDFTYGAVSYNINTPSWVTSSSITTPDSLIASVPVPATGWLFLVGILGLISISHRRKFG